MLLNLKSDMYLCAQIISATQKSACIWCIERKVEDF
jgi:hypothetical protein